MQYIKYIEKKLIVLLVNILLIIPAPILIYYWHIFINQHKLLFTLPKEKFDDYFKKEDGEIFEIQNYKLYKFNSGSERNIVFFHGSILSPKIHYKNMKKMSESANVWTYMFPKFGNKGRLNEFTILRSSLVITNFITNKEKNVVLFGQSLGCTPALFASYKINLPVILENPFFNGKSFLKARLSIFKRWIITAHYKNDFYISNIKNKIYVLAAEDENIINKNDTSLLTKDRCTMFFTCKGTTHTTMGKAEEYYKNLEIFLLDLFGPNE